jgi:hypothetical protein
VGTDWCGNVKSITEQIQHTLNIAKVTAQEVPARRVAPRRSPASLDAVRSQPEVDTQDDDDDEQKVEVGQCAGSADQPLAHCAESAAAHIRPCPEGKPSWLPDCLLDQGTLLNIWLYFHHGTHA